MLCHAYANLSRNTDGSKIISYLYGGVDEREAFQLAKEAVAGGAESAVVKGIGGEVLLHISAPPTNLAS